MSDMNRRRFLMLAAAAPVVVAAAHYLPAPGYGKFVDAGLNGTDVTGCSLEWSGCRTYQVGDIIETGGFVNQKWNGKWRVTSAQTLERC